MSVLIVDDDPDQVILLRRALSSLGDIRFARSGAEALRVALARPPSVVLLDAELGDENGLSVCARFKNDDALCSAAIIFVTAHEDEAFVRVALEAGAVAVVTKPIDVRTFLQNVESHLPARLQRSEDACVATSVHVGDPGGRRPPSGKA